MQEHTDAHTSPLCAAKSPYSGEWHALPAVVSSVGFDAAALGTLVHHLSWFQLQALDEFFGGIPFGYGSLWETQET